MSILAGQLDDLAALLERRKHLPGQHDQQTHTPKKYGKGKSPSTIPGMAKYNRLAKDRQWVRHPIMDDSWDANADIKPGVEAGARKGGKFGLCAYHSMEACADDPSLKVMVGIAMTDVDQKRLLEFDYDQYWEPRFLGTVHVWNEDVNGMVVDHAFGSRGARGSVYIGKAVPDDLLRGMKNDGELLSYAHDVVNASRPVSTMTEDEYREMWEEWRTQLKHQAGRHDQSKHTPQAFLSRAAAASMTVGTPVTMDWLSQPSQEVLFNELSLLNATKAKRALVTAKISQEDIAGLKRITTRLFPGYTYDHQRVLHNRDGMPCSGSYRTDGSILISPHTLLDRPSKLADTMRHEMGHHKLRQMKLGNTSKMRDARQVIDRAGLKRFNNDQLANAGLRMYSLSAPNEFLADTYVVMGLGTPEQKKLLLNIWGEAGYTDLEAIYKQMLGIMYANEIRAITNTDGTVDFIEAPVLVERAICDKTPWYYTDVR